MIVNATLLEKELKALLTKHGFTPKTKITNNMLAIYLITCIREFVKHTSSKTKKRKKI